MVTYNADAVLFAYWSFKFQVPAIPDLAGQKLQGTGHAPSSHWTPVYVRPCSPKPLSLTHPPPTHQLGRFCPLRSLSLTDSSSPSHSTLAI